MSIYIACKKLKKRLDEVKEKYFNNKENVTIKDICKKHIIKKLI
jgi:hypothetical protein